MPPTFGQQQPDRTCHFCRSAIPARALKCAFCGEWVNERTEYSGAALGLRVVGTVWIALSILAALVWVGIGMEGDESDFAFAIAFAVFFQGWLIGLAAVVLAETSPRRQ